MQSSSTVSRIVWLALAPIYVSIMYENASRLSLEDNRNTCWLRNDNAERDWHTEMPQPLLPVSPLDYRPPLVS
jgi:alpha-beta hydrolase superfamily lysophospholipase